MAALSIARAYQNSFQTHPNVTLALTGGTLNAFGDSVAQISQNLVRFCAFLGFQDKDPNSPSRHAKNTKCIALTTMHELHGSSSLD
jgi:protein Mpv17